MKVAALVAVFVLASDAAAHCVDVDNSTHYEVLSGSSSVPSGSSFVVEWGPRGFANPLASSSLPDEDPKGWKLIAGGAALEYSTTNIAPGLFVLVPSRVTGKVEVTTPSGEARTIKFTSEALPALLPAPRVKSLERRVIKGSRGHKRTVGIVTLRGDRPSGSIALVAYVGDQAVAWARAYSSDENGGINVFPDALPCWSLPNEAPAPRAGTKVQLAWLDETGRLSQRSTVVMK